jgi:hypothetical protein
MARQGAARDERDDERDGDDEFALWVEAKTTARTPRALWGLVRSATRLAWAASPRGLTVAAGLQVVTAVGAGLTVLVGQRVLADLLGVAEGDDVGRRVVVDGSCVCSGKFTIAVGSPRRVRRAAASCC